jgi:predicted dienelactone hydrolase
MAKRRILWWLLGVLGAALLAGFGALVWWAWGFAEVNTQARLPDDLTLVPPAADVPPDIAAFAGVWGGDRWDGVLPHTLAVERVQPDGTANIVYALGMDRIAQSPQSARRVTGTISGGHLQVILPNREVLDYRPSADGGLLGSTTTPPGWRTFALLHRIDAPDTRSLIRAADTRADRLWEEIDIPEHSTVGTAAGQSLTLRGTLYRVAMAGPRPLIILNHGSAADSSIERVLRYEAQSRYFLALGYSVLIPMRKGRGASGGPLIETEDLSGVPSIQIDSGVEDIDAVVEYMRGQPFVDPKWIVVVGEQRGGLLSVIYAERHPEKVMGVINVSGSWWPPPDRIAETSAILLAHGEQIGGPPMLWIYADGDPYYPLPQIEHDFAAFRAQGGNARLVLVAGSSYANHVFSWAAKWQRAAEDFLVHEDHPRPGVGLSLVNLRNPVGNGTIQAAIYYPGEAGDEKTVAGVWVVDALRDAPPSPGKFPILLLSHDGGGNRLAQHDLATALVREGFMVVAVTHPGDNSGNGNDWQTEPVLIGREYDARAALDQLLAMPVLGEHADPDRVGIIGYGFGAYTALLLAGAKPDLAQILPPEKRPHHLELFRDDRIKAALLLAPGPGDLFDAKSLKDVTLPIQIYAARDDEVFPLETNSERLRALLPTPPSYVEAAGADHYAFVAPCSATQRNEAPEVCADRPGFDRAAFHAKLATEIAAFFHRTLAGR